MKRSERSETAKLIEVAATIENAEYWERRTDKFVFCLDCLDLSLTADGDKSATAWVELLEFRFGLLLVARADRALTVTRKDRARDAFAGAIKAGRLSHHPYSAIYAGRFMFMGRATSGRDLFKHKDTREYLKG